MKKVFKRASLIALSALMLGTSVASLASCGKGDGVIDVYVFAGTEDQETNSDMIADWAAEYTERLKKQDPNKFGADFQVVTNCTFESDTTKYFQTLTNAIAAGSATDVFYVSPKYVKAWSRNGTILELSGLVDFKEEGMESYLSDVYPQALGLYGYDGTTVGSPVSYRDGKFYNAKGNETNMYAFPKDYSTFGLGYNKVFFTDEYKAKYTSTGAKDESGVIVNELTGEDAAGVVNIGVPTTYFPYNFYVYDSYEKALAAGDPVAEASKSVGGYTVTIPGFPGETYKRSNPDTSKNYDDSIGYVVYTYAEYSAITWALTYYWNKYEPSHATVYGNDQYEGTLYLLPWLAGNDADYINGTDSAAGVSAYTSVLNDKNDTYVSNQGRTVTYGVNSDKFIETYGAFCAYGSDWNGNAYFAGDGNEASGYTQFKSGNVLFYGVGTWDAAGFDGVDLSVLTYAVMPEPVAESNALYSKIKGADYQVKEYGTKKEYSREEIIAAMEERQDEWAGRIDSVGYGVNAKSVKKEEDWFAGACASLAANITLNKEGQARLTYSGSQLPNFESMVKDYVYGTNTFADAIFPENPDFMKYYALANELVSKTDKTTLKDYMAANHPDMKYNERYGRYTLKKISTPIRAFLVLNILSLDRDSRNLMNRMVSGDNGVTDSCTYTFNSAWIDSFSSHKAVNLIAWTQKVAKTYKGFQDAAAVAAGTIVDTNYMTPAAYCKYWANDVQKQLDRSITEEREALNG